MSKENEISYIQSIGADGANDALNKPFSDPLCWQYFFDIGNVLSPLPEPPARILDLGVGTGWTSIFIAKRGYEVIAQDIAPDMIALANEKRKTPIPLLFTTVETKG